MKQAVIVWENNVPRLEGRDSFPVQQIKTVAQAILAEPFEDPLELWPEYVGMSKGEVVLRQLIHRATLGEETATRELLDRLIGKPKMQVETKRLNMSYQDFLDEIDRQTNNLSPTPTE